MSLFLRLLGEEDKGAALEAAVRAVAAGEADARVFEVDPESFGQVPGAPFAYWVSDQTREIFVNHPGVERDHLVASGTGTLNDLRFIRCWWEVDSSDTWFPYAKGGAFSPFYFDHYLSVHWARDGRMMKAWIIERYGGGHWARNIRSTEHYFRPGLTWPRRTNGLSFRVMPAGCIFADKGPAAFVERDNPQSLLSLCALINSAPFGKLVSLQLARTELAQSFEVGLIQQTPVPYLSESDTEQLATLAHRAWSLKRNLDTPTLTSHAFALPALLAVNPSSPRSPRLRGESVLSLDCAASAWAEHVRQTQQALAQIQAEIDDRCFDLYGFDAADRAAALGADLTADESAPDPDSGEGGADDDPDEDGAASSASLRCNPQTLSAELFDWLVGVAFGRFDLYLATGLREPPLEPEPFDPLPVCSPGMLTGADGLPCAGPPSGYPLDFPADGILVDDAGIDGNAPVETDLPRRLRQIIQHLWGDDATAIEAELCQLLRVRTLREWLRRPAGYFADHLGRWSKSRRKAPLCWPLSTESGGYTLWIYYPRLTDQTLYTCVNEHLDPKLREIEGDLDRLRAKGQPDAQLDTRSRRQVDDLVGLQREVRALREELLRVARIPYKPDQNDGVLITAAPLWKLFRHKPWQKELKRCWEALAAGDYDWAHLALAIWPGRVRERCRTDKSIAIAHGLENLHEA